MIEQVLPDLFRIEIPLPNSPLRSLNSYLIKGKERFLIIDTGMNREECLRPMLSSLEELDVDLNRTDLFITHLHADHLGLAGKLATENSRIYFNEKELSFKIFNTDRDKEVIDEHISYYCAHGFPEDELRAALKSHPGNKYSPADPLKFSLLNDGDRIDIGDYSFRCIETPGHTPGHMCLYEPDRKILVSGDHILFDITPNISFWRDFDNSLKEYLTSLEKTYSLDVRLILPGHRSIMTDHRRRITELKEHHRARLDEIVSALKGGDKSAWEVASYIGWDMSYSSWELFPPAQKWFAFGETIAHLIFLEAEGRIRRKENGGKGEVLWRRME